MFSAAQTEILDQLADDPHLAEHDVENLTRRDINNLSARVRAHIEQLDDEMKDSPSQMGELQGLRETRFMQCNLLVRTGRTFRDLPVEALLQIFRSCFKCLQIPIRRTDALWALSWTCSRWRQIVLNESLFWSNVQFQLMVKMGDDVADTLIKEVYRRGGRCPLNLTVSWYNLPISKPAWASVRRLLCLVFDSGSIERLCALSLEHLPKHFLTELETLYFPNVKELSMAVPVSNSEVCAFVRRLVLDQMPCLTHIRLGQTSSLASHPGDPGLLGDAKWTRFFDIKLFDDLVLPISPVHDRLRGCVELVSLRLRIGGESMEDAHTSLPSMPMIHLPSLKTLNVEIDEESTFEPPMATFRFFSLLDLPSITHLQLKARCRVWEEKIKLLSILTDYICTLKTLKGLHLIKFEGAQIDTFIAGLPNLRAISIFCPGDRLSRQTIDALESGTQGLELQTLDCMVAAADVDAFMHMLEIQWTISMQRHSASSGGCIKTGFISIQDGNRALGVKYTNLLKDLKLKTGVDPSVYNIQFMAY